MTDLWDPERLATVGWIMNRYSDFLRPGDRVRIGQEGDPCTTYRSSEDAPSARVENVEREVDGTVRFRAVMESSGATIQLDNRNVASDRIWELHPSHVEEFRQRVQTERTHRGSDDDNEVNRETEEEEEETSGHRPVDDGQEDTLTDLFKEPALEQRLADMEFRGTEMEKTIGGAIRELAGDLMRIYNGDAPAFSIKFVDRYDLALHTDASSSSSYKGAHHAAGRGRSRDTRHDFSEDDVEDERGSRGSRDSSDRHDFDPDGENERGSRRSRASSDRHDFDPKDDVLAAYTPDDP